VESDIITQLRVLPQRMELLVEEPSAQEQCWNKQRPEKNQSPFHLGPDCLNVELIGCRAGVGVTTVAATAIRIARVVCSSPTASTTRRVEEWKDDESIW